MRNSGSEQVREKDNVINGPPGLLFGLTLLVLIAAGLYFSLSTDAVSASEKKTSAASAVIVQQALDREDAHILDPNLPEP